MRFGVVLLAAGGSSRMGRTKGLLPYLGRTLIAHAARTALASGAAEVVVVLGADADALRRELAGLRVRIVVNAGWTEGMGSSLRLGIGALAPDLDGAVVALGDQPRVTPAHLRALAEGLADAPVVASSYDGVLGAPCAFARAEFARLLKAEGDAGMRAFVRSGEEPVATIAFAAANADVDTPESYQDLVSSAASEDATEIVGEEGSGRAPPVALSPSL